MRKGSLFLELRQFDIKRVKLVCWSVQYVLKSDQCGLKGEQIGVGSAQFDVKAEYVQAAILFSVEAPCPFFSVPSFSKVLLRCKSFISV